MLTFEEIISNAEDIVTLKDGVEYKLNNIKEELLDTIKFSYSSPSYAIGSLAPMDILLKSGIWLIANLNNTVDYMSEECNQLIFAIKPKYDFLMIYKKNNGVICDKVPMVNLANNTNKLIKFINDSISNENK